MRVWRPARQPLSTPATKTCRRGPRSGGRRYKVRNYAVRDLAFSCEVSTGSPLGVHSREQLARLVIEQSQTQKAAASAFHVSQKTAAKWVCRYKEKDAAGLADHSSRPHRSPRQISPPLLEMVLSLRRERRNGWRIAHELKLSRATISRILRRAGMNRLRSLDTPPIQR